MKMYRVVLITKRGNMASIADNTHLIYTLRQNLQKQMYTD